MSKFHSLTNVFQKFLYLKPTTWFICKWKIGRKWVKEIRQYLAWYTLVKCLYQSLSAISSLWFSTKSEIPRCLFEICLSVDLPSSTSTKNKITHLEHFLQLLLQYRGVCIQKTYKMTLRKALQSQLLLLLLGKKF